MVKVDHLYMENHLIDYVLFQMQQGYREKDIKEALLGYGYPQQVIHTIFNRIDAGPHLKRKQKRIKYSVSALSKDMREYVISLLIDYIMKEKKQGYRISVIQNALIRYGHNKELLDAAIKAIKSGRVVSYQFPSAAKFPQNVVFSCALILMFSFIVFLSITTNTSIAKVLLSFVPSIVGFLILHFLLAAIQHRRLVYLLPLLSVAVTVGLFIASLQLVNIFQYSQPEVLLLLNVLLGFVAILLLCFFSKQKDTVLVEVADKGNTEVEMRSEQDAPLGDLIREEMQRIDNPEVFDLQKMPSSKASNKAPHVNKEGQNKIKPKNDRVPLRNL